MPYPPTALPGSAARATGENQVFSDGFTMAFQPIYDVTTGDVFAHEALVRSPFGGPAAGVLQTVTQGTRYSFDRKCRIKAIAMATALGLNTRLSVNCMPNAVLDPASCIRSTVIAADHYGFDVANLIVEFNEAAYLRDPAHMRAIVASYRKRGFMTAIDDFGARFAGVGALCDMETDVIKLDMALIRGIDRDEIRQRTVRSIAGMCRELGSAIIVEGVETAEEFDVLRSLGITRFQGFLLGKPTLEGLCPGPLIPLPVAA